MFRSIFRTATKQQPKAILNRSFSAVPTYRLPKVNTKSGYSNSRNYSRETFFESHHGKSAIVVVGSAICIGVFAYQGYVIFFGPGSVYPSQVRKLLKEGGDAFLQPESKRNLDHAINYYTQALELINTKYSSEKYMERDSPYVTGIVARIAEVYLEAGNKEMAIEYFKNLLNRVFSKEELLDYKLVVKKLVSQKKTDPNLENSMRGIGTISKLAEAYENIGDSKLPPGFNLNRNNYGTIPEYKVADELYTWILNTVLSSYYLHFNKPKTQSFSLGGNYDDITDDILLSDSYPDFNPKTLPPYLSEYLVVSLLYNASNFYSKIGKYDLASPLLQRSLDLLGKSKNAKNETNVCKSCVLMTHLVSIAKEQNEIEAAKFYTEKGINIAKEFTDNEECLKSLVSFVFADGYLKEMDKRYSESRIEYRKALELSKSLEYEEGIANATESIERVSNLMSS
ncbi:hypothetical protein BB560_003591 [Smittium megazygosporum]|uniref:MalT-like TPR region domain-containing protein n=1 Tax=Smittium megazygosporum TaxID=133381 RepID=A0A2T9ZBK8_9FUNG|nr:hypothetical protein BB560_003591 [Smittium megazygosporum]